MSELVERVARAMMTALEASESYCDPSHGVDCVILDGDFNLNNVARAAIAAMREPTHEMTYAGHDVPTAVGLAAPPADEVWQAMIDEALKP